MNKEKVFNFYNKLSGHENDRYRSFEHCYLFFQDINDNNIWKKNLDIASLHLSFYLASWGMYRGSSFLLQYDYKAIIPVVKIIFKKEYNPLWEFDQKISISNKSKFIKLVIKLENELERELDNLRKEWIKYKINTIDSRAKHSVKKVSSILTTKIIMGTIGCVPAYDRFFMSGLKYSDSDLIQKFGKNSYSQLINYYLDNKKQLLYLRKEIKKITKVNYPLMKIIDSYFWQIGFEEDMKHE